MKMFVWNPLCDAMQRIVNQSKVISFTELIEWNNEKPKKLESLEMRLLLANQK